MTNKIILGKGTENGTVSGQASPWGISDEALLRDGSAASPDGLPSSDELPEPLDENLWGNDRSIRSRLDENQLADRRLFTRVRHMRSVECHKIYDDIAMDPVVLVRPIIFTICDLSMGGIDIISDYDISIGKILAIQLVLDDKAYEFKGQVMFCLQSDDKFRAGLKIVQREKAFIQHLKIYIARITLNKMTG